MDLSIVIPIYNCEDTINDINRYDRNTEVIGVDDGYTANTIEKFIRNNEVLIYKRKNGGVGSARSKGISQVTGRYIMFHDADDIVDPRKLFEVWEKVKSNTNLIFSDVAALKEEKLISRVTQSQKVKLYKNIADIGKHRIPIGVKLTMV